MFTKTLISEFFTTVTFSQALQSLYLMTIRLPLLRKWNDNNYLENQLLSYIWTEKSKMLLFYNWRSAIYHALKMIWLNKNDEVIVSWYTCVSVSNAVIQAWAKIIYSDINKKNLWLNIESLRKNINKNSKVIIVQHTFWKPSDIWEIIKLATENNILVIEDCAHSLWSRVKWTKLGSFWDFAIFSTGRDKVISSVTWWFLLINNKKYFSEIKNIKNKLKMPSILLTLRNLYYNLVWFKAYKLYNIWIFWKLTIFFARKLKLITEILTISEKNCKFKEFNLKLPNSLAYLASKQLLKIKFISNRRSGLAEFYDDLIKNKKITVLFSLKKWEKNNYFRYPILFKSEKIKDDCYKYMRQNNVILWNTWSWTNIVPIWSDLKKAQYIEWTCPIAEDLSKRILTLPNHNRITLNDTKRIVQLLNNFK